MTVYFTIVKLGSLKALGWVVTAAACRGKDSEENVETELEQFEMFL